jgi:signal transduction histidine kinase
MQRRSFWFSRSTFQAQVETLLIGGSIWLGIVILQIYLHLTVSGRNQWELSFYINVLCLFWFILRLSLPARFLSKDTLKQVFSSFMVFLPLHTLYMLSIYLLLLFPNASTKNLDQFYFSMQLALCIPLFGLLFLIGITHLLQFWNRLRQQSLYWTLIHAHTMGLVIVLGAASAFFIVRYIEPFPKIDFMILSSLFFAAEIFIVILFLLLLLLVPPLALLAYFTTHPTIKRIKTLVTITNELRSGQYATRAPIEGKDEVAQLQKNFNAMADELEKNIHDLQTERDYVASLLNERRNLFANVSHELRTPIATLRGYLESTLKDRSQISEPTLWEDLAVMEREVLQLQERADELFALSKAEVGQIMIQDIPCDVRQLVQTLVDSYAPLAWRTNKVEVVADIPDEVPMVNADEQHLEQALKNIVRNALRHTPPGGVIALVIVTEPERVGISIEDTGEGIAPEELEHIWERFYRAKTAQRQDGAGIGLSLVKDWITAMGGSVAATSTLGEGSCFTLYLPRLHEMGGLRWSEQIS